MISLARLFSLMKREAVLSAAAALALLSMLWVPPDGAYLSYVDWRTMAQLFCLMAVMAGLRELGVFSRLGRQLLCRVRSARQLECVLVFLCFFTSMAITNDVALLTFVPFSPGGADTGRTGGAGGAGGGLSDCGCKPGEHGHPHRQSPEPVSLRPVRPGTGGFSGPDAALHPSVRPDAAALVSCRGGAPPWPGPAPGGAEPSLRRRRTGMYLLLFLASVSSVAKLLPVWLLTAAVVVCVLAADRRVLRRVDWSLLLTFAAFFVFIGNMGRVPAFRSLLEQAISGHELVTAVCASQVISNVPAALLLSGFTSELGCPYSWGPTWAGWGP